MKYENKMPKSNQQNRITKINRLIKFKEIVNENTLNEELF